MWRIESEAIDPNYKWKCFEWFFWLDKHQKQFIYILLIAVCRGLWGLADFFSLFENSWNFLNDIWNMEWSAGSLTPCWPKNWYPLIRSFHNLVWFGNIVEVLIKNLNLNQENFNYFVKKENLATKIVQTNNFTSPSLPAHQKKVCKQQWDW